MNGTGLCHPRTSSVGWPVWSSPLGPPPSSWARQACCPLGTLRHRKVFADSRANSSFPRSVAVPAMRGRWPARLIELRPRPAGSRRTSRGPEFRNCCTGEQAGRSSVMDWQRSVVEGTSPRMARLRTRTTGRSAANPGKPRWRGWQSGSDLVPRPSAEASSRSSPPHLGAFLEEQGGIAVSLGIAFERMTYPS